MITDKLCTFFDNVAAASSMTGAVIDLPIYAGHNEPAIITVVANGPNAAAATYVATLEESADGSTFTAVGAITIERPDAMPALGVMALPLSVSGPYLRMSIAITGSPGGNVWAGVTRDHFAPMAPGLYIDHGKAVL